VKAYTADDWKRQQAEQGAIYAEAAAAMRSGVDPASPAVMDIAERHRLSIDKWFYRAAVPCTRGWRRCTKPTSVSGDDRQGGRWVDHVLAAAIRANA
jgi:hypothetical protein